MICTSKRAETCIEVLPCSGPRLSRQVLHMSKYVVINALTHLSLAYGSLCGERADVTYINIFPGSALHVVELFDRHDLSVGDYNNHK